MNALRAGAFTASQQKGDRVRLLVVSAALLGTAACAAPPPVQPGANCPAARQELSAMHAAARPQPPAPPPAVLVPPAPPPAVRIPPPPAAEAAPRPVVAVAFRPLPFPSISLFRRTPARGRLTLSNFTVPLADVEALVTPYPDCIVHPGQVPADFKLPLNGTWTIPTPAGADVCWRRLAPPQVAQRVRPALPVAAQWNRAFTAPGRFIDAQL